MARAASDAPGPGRRRRPARRSVPMPTSALRCAVALALAAVLAGCASDARRGGDAGARPPVGATRTPAPSDRDGPGLDPPAGLATLPDAEPRVEPIRSGGANKPYQVLGRDYQPIARDVAFAERGLASWYGRKFHGRRTANGEVYDMYAMTAAHPTLPLPSYARIRNPANGREVVVRVNDRGPFHPGRIVDLSYAAALRLDLLRGVAPVELERLTFDEIRAGNWRRGEPAPKPADPAPLVAVAAGAGERAGADAAPARPGAADGPGPASQSPPPQPPPAAAATPGFWLQLGAFREAAGAEGFRRRVAAEFDWLAPLLATVDDAPLHRVQAGPFASRDRARDTAQRVREALGLVPLVVERR